VRTKAVLRKTMSNAAQMPALARTAALNLVERYERHTGSRMAAYEIVATTVGTSASWLRKFIKGYEAKEPGLTVGWNLIAHHQAVYNRVCVRVNELEAKEAAKDAAITEQINAVIASHPGLAAGAKATEGSGEEVAATPEGEPQ
jgi:hypothetical protein